MSPRIFCGVFPTGIVYADREREDADRDYAQLAFLPFDTLALKIAADCPPDLRAEIGRDAARIQARMGQPYQTSEALTQTVILGERAQRYRVRAFKRGRVVFSATVFDAHMEAALQQAKDNSLLTNVGWLIEPFPSESSEGAS
jgi:hypothetical protein